jgi:flagellar assembly protein FliH
MSDGEVLKSIQSIRQGWGLEERIRKASDELRERELAQVRKEIEAARLEARELLDNAEQESINILSDARNQAEDLVSSKEAVLDARENELNDLAEKNRIEVEESLEKAREKEAKGHEEGVSQGYEKGYQDGMAQFSEMITSFSNAIGEVAKQREALVQENIDSINRFVQAYSEKLVGPLAETSIQFVFHNISKALQEVHRAVKLKVIVSQKDYESIQAVESDFKSLFGPTQEVELIKDLHMSAGGCLLETELGNVDATLESQVAILKQELCEDGGHD